MEKCHTRLLLFLTIYVYSLLYCGHDAMASPEYTRPQPRPLIITPHNRSESDPQQVHISLVRKDHMRVTYVTSDKKTPSKVEYGKSKGKYEASATGESTRYRYFLYKSGHIHHVTIGPLEANTNYYYKCGGRGPEFSFKTPPSTFPLELAIVGDLGQTEWTSSTLLNLVEKDYDLLLLPGDLSYADFQQPLWDSFGRLVEPYASRRPWMVTEGNHEIESFPILYPKGFIAYNSRWLMPYKESSSTSNLYYSFDVVGTHVVMLGSYTDFDADSDQYKWLEADLASIDRTTTPWIIVLIHAPWYNTNSAHEGEGESMRLAMEHLLYKARVDAVFAGHVHAYERFTRIYDNNVDPCGPVYFTVGDGGNREGLATSFEESSPSISVYREASFGHGRLRIYNNTHAHWTWERNDDPYAFTSDHFWLENLSGSKLCSKETQQFSSSPSSMKDEL